MERSEDRIRIDTGEEYNVGEVTITDANKAVMMTIKKLYIDFIYRLLIVKNNNLSNHTLSSNKTED